MEDCIGPMNMTRTFISGQFPVLLPMLMITSEKLFAFTHYNSNGYCVYLPAARGFLSTSQWLYPSTMESSSSLFWLTSVWPPLWTQASSPEVGV